MSKFLQAGSSTARIEDESSVSGSEMESETSEFLSEKQSERQTDSMEIGTEPQIETQTTIGNESESEQQILTDEKDPATWPAILPQSFREK